jgi:hypothetical protein
MQPIYQKISNYLQKESNYLWGFTALIFLLGFIFFCYFFSKIPLLHDGDSYYHLAVARLYAQKGIVDHLDWARFSVMNPGFGDKEFLFHLLLMPFVFWLPADLGGKIALALLNATSAAVIANLSIRAIGKWGVFIPVWAFGTSAAFFLRMSRLRPEILSLLILMCVGWVASRQKYRWLILFSALYALSYTAFHVLIGLSIGWFIICGWIDQRWEWRLPIYTILGSAIGLLIHPHFPSNLHIWAIQNIDFFILKNQIGVGNEIQPAAITTIFSLNFGWLLGLIIFWRSTQRSPIPSKLTGPESIFLINAIAFSLLYLLMQRFSIYCIPFVTLAVLFWIKRRHRQIGNWTYLPWHGRVPFMLTFCICLVTSIFSSWYVYVNLSDHGVFDSAHRRDWEALGKVIPDNAQVAAPWDAAEIYVWAAPQAYYINLLDPVFMVKAYPKLHSIQQKIWDGTEPDVPLAVKLHLNSDYIVFPYRKHLQLYRRLSADPRVRLLYRGYTAVFGINPKANHQFITDWEMVADSEGRPPRNETSDLNRVGAAGRGDKKNSVYDGYVSIRDRKGSNSCVDMAHVETIQEPVRVEYELAAYGGFSFRLNNNLVLSNAMPGKATLGEGVRFRLDLEAGQHTFRVRTCSHEGRIGFYLLERKRAQASH